MVSQRKVVETRNVKQRFRFLYPRDSSNKSQLGVGTGSESRRVAAPSQQQLGQPATSERDAAAATASGGPGRSGTGRASGPGGSGVPATASHDVSSTPRASAHESLHGAYHTIVRLSLAELNSRPPAGTLGKIRATTRNFVIFRWQIGLSCLAIGDQLPINSNRFR